MLAASCARRAVVKCSACSVRARGCSGYRTLAACSSGNRNVGRPHGGYRGSARASLTRPTLADFRAVLPCYHPPTNDFGSGGSGFVYLD